MKQSKPASKRNFFETFATKVTKATGSTPVFICAFGIVLIWALTGPIFDYSETWQLVINTGTTIITFLMVFLIQKTQNKDSLAIQLKLNELVASSRSASNRLVDVEDLTEEEMEVLKKFYMKLATLSKKESALRLSHSIDEAEEKHREKTKAVKAPQKGKTKPASATAEKDASAKKRKPRRKPRPKQDNPEKE
jgi:low affinity Fe/Cu permease